VNLQSAAAKRIFVYNSESRRARYSNLVDIADKLDLSILRFDVILDETSNTAVHAIRSLIAETQAAVTFGRNELETGCCCPYRWL